MQCAKDVPDPIGIFLIFLGGTPIMRTRFFLLALLLLAPAFALKPIDATAAFEPQRGLWWNPARSGHGIEIQKVGTASSVIWYTYNTDKTPTWYLSQGKALNGQQWTAPVDKYSWNAATKTATPTQVGSLSLNFTDATHGTFSWTLNGQSGSEPFELFVVSSTPPATDYSGTWYPSSQPGQGLTVLTQGSTEFTTLYFYDSLGAPRWALGSTTGKGAGSTSYTLESYTGFCPGCTHSTPTKVAAGSLTRTFSSQSAGSLSTNVTLPSPLSGSWNLSGLAISRLSDALSAVGGNQAPTASNLSVQTNPSIPYVDVKLIGTDPNGDKLTYELLSPSTGTGYAEAYVTPQSGTLRVTLQTGYSGNISLSYRATDGQLFSNTATVSIQVSTIIDQHRVGNLDVDPRTYAGFSVSHLSPLLLGAPGTAPTAAPSIDLSDNFPIPGAQGGQGSCVGWATAYALKSYQERMEMSWALDSSSHLFSPAWIYNQINGGQDKGSYIHDAMELIRTSGSASLATMPYNENDFTTRPGTAAIQEASRFKARAWSRLSNTSEIKGALANRMPVVIGIKVYSNFNNLRGGNSVYNSTSGSYLGGHAITITGYDDNAYGGAFKVINSWGTDWGDNGYFWLPYSFFDTVVKYTYVLEDTDNGAGPGPEPPPPAQNQPNLQVVNWNASYDPKPRGTGTLQWRVVNAGNGTAVQGAYVNLMLSTNMTITSNDEFIIYETIPFDLQPGGAAFRDSSNAINFSFPDGLNPGTYYMALWVDDTDLIEESNENDNVSLGSNQLTIVNNLPDLVVRSWYAYWDALGNSQLEYVVANDGASTANMMDWDINLILSPDQVAGNGNEVYLFYEDAGFSLAPGQTVFRNTANAAYFNFSGVPAGTYYMALWVDDLNQVTESDELNNVSWSWPNTIELTGTSRTGEIRAGVVEEGRFYNGRILPPSDVLMKKVRISRTDNGGTRLDMLDETSQPRSKAQTPERFTKENRAASVVVFPITQEIPMP